MSRSLTAGFASHVAGVAHRRVWCLRLDLLDGTKIGLTDHDRPILFDLGDGAGEILYRTDLGMLPSNVSVSTGFGTDDFTVDGPLSEVFTAAGVLGGRFDEATAFLFQVRWDNLADGQAKIFRGYVVSAEQPTDGYKLTIHSEMTKFRVVTGKACTPYCRTWFGSPDDCTIVPESIVGTVTAVTDRSKFTVSFAGTYATGYFDIGRVEFLTGDLAGTRGVEIDTWTGAGVIQLFMPLVAAPTIGDTCTIKVGCLRILKSDDPTARTCAFYENAVNFRGEPFTPGTDATMSCPVPSDG